MMDEKTYIIGSSKYYYTVKNLEKTLVCWTHYIVSEFPNCIGCHMVKHQQPGVFGRYLPYFSLNLLFQFLSLNRLNYLALAAEETDKLASAHMRSLSFLPTPFSFIPSGVFIYIWCSMPTFFVFLYFFISVWHSVFTTRFQRLKGPHRTQRIPL